MNIQVTLTSDEQSFTLSANEHTQTYTNDKVGKRQAMIDGLNAIPTVTVGNQVYLSSQLAQVVVAAVLFPAGIQSKVHYQTVCRVSEKACAYIGYGEEVELSPPDVPFAQRGRYRQHYPTIEAQQVREALALAGTSSLQPQNEILCVTVWHTIGVEIYGEPWQELSEYQQERIQAKVDELVSQTGWDKDTNRQPPYYYKPLPIDEQRAQKQLESFLLEQNGLPISVSQLIYHVQKGAYGRSFYTDDLRPQLQSLSQTALQTHGYNPDPEDGEYQPLAPTCSPAMRAAIIEQLAQLQPVATKKGACLLWQDVLSAILTCLANNTLRDWQVQRLIQHPPFSQALSQLGYESELTWCLAYHFATESTQAQYVIFKTIRVQNDLDKTLSLAKGLTVYTPAVTIDEENNTLIYLEMVGVKQSVKANWAALMGGNRVHWLHGQRVQVEGMKRKVTQGGASTPTPKNGKPSSKTASKATKLPSNQ